MSVHGGESMTTLFGREQVCENYLRMVFI
jgi:hypothetical protein